MAAYVEHSFKKGFLLDEEKLRKLVNLICQRLGKTEPPIEHRFKVFRADSYSYETTNVEDIVNEDHTDWRRITKLQIEAIRDREFEFELTFSEKGTSLTLNGDDRDQVYLLLSDLREYLNNEVNTGLNISPYTRRMLSLLLPITLFFVPFGIWILWKTPSAPTPQDIQSVDIKLDFLISQRQNEFRILVPVFFLMPLIMILLVTEIVDKAIVFFCPYNLFLFGPQKQRYERRKRIVTNVLWGVLIAFIISVLAGLVVWKLTV